MSNHVKHCRCPKCGEIATAQQGHQLAHGGMHTISHTIKHPNPIAIGLGVLMMGAQYVKNRWFTCTNCGHKFFGG